MVKRFIRAALEAALRALVESIHRRRVRRVMESLDGCEFCGEPGELFIDVTPNHRHVTVRLACVPCKDEAVRHGAQVLMAADGRPVVH